MPVWTLKVGGGPKRVNHAAVAVGDKVYFFGGYCTGNNYKKIKPMEVNVMQTVNYQWRVLKAPAPSSSRYNEIPYQRYGHTAVAENHLVYIWGGRNTYAACNILFCFDTNALVWSRPTVTGTIPSARDGHSACIINNAMYIFGGFEGLSNQFAQDVHKLDLRSLEWSHVQTRGNPPSFRDYHSATAINNCMYVFGGRQIIGPHQTQHEVYCDQLIYLDIKTRSWIRPQVEGFRPVGRRSHSAFCYKDKLFVFGGYNGILQTHYNDLVQYDPETCSWSIVKPTGKGPCPRRRQSCCVIGDRVFLFGGTSPSPCLMVEPLGWWRFLNFGLEPVEARLMDHNDLHVLDFAPSLKTLAIMKILEHKLKQNTLPESIRLDIRSNYPTH